jgi:hypothetical protein
MNQLVPIAAYGSPTLIAAAGERAQERFIEFFTANIRNRNTRRAYAQAVSKFLAWCEDHRVRSITAVQPVHVAGYIEELTRARSAPTAKQRLAAIRHLFDWLVVGQVKRSRSRPSPASTTVSRRWESSLVEHNRRNSERTVDSISCASSTTSTGRASEASMWVCQRSRSTLAPAQRLWGRSSTPNRSPISR